MFNVIQCINEKYPKNTYYIRKNVYKKKIFSYREKIYKINCLCLIYDHDSTLFTLIAHGIYHVYMLLHYHNNYNRTVEIKLKMPGMHVYRSLPYSLHAVIYKMCDKIPLPCM